VHPGVTFTIKRLDAGTQSLRVAINTLRAGEARAFCCC